MSAGANKRRADLKVVLLGTMDVGKTALIHRYLDGKFIQPENTIGASFFLKQWGKYNVAIWDTAGQERFTGLSSFYCRLAGAAILAFDLNSMYTLEDLKSRFLPLLQSAEPDCLCVLIGTKSDLVTDDKNRVPYQVAANFVSQLNPQRHLEELPYFETSSLTGENVDKAFEYVFENILPLGKNDQGQRSKTDPSVVYLESSKTTMTVNQEKSKCSC